MHKFIQNKKRMVIILGITLAIASVYLFGLVFYSSHFLPNTSINGADVSSMNLSRANETIKGMKPQITVLQKNSDGNGTYGQKLLLKDINSDITYDASANLKDQNIILWFVSMFNQKDLEASRITGTVIPERINDLAEKLYCLQSANIVKPVNAHYEIEDGNVILVSSSDGSYIDKDTAVKAVTDYINQMFTKVDSLTLDITDLYEKATVLDDDPSLANRKTDIENMINKKLELNIYDQKIEVSKEDICSLLELTDTDPKINEDGLYDFVLKLAIENDGSNSFINKNDLRTKLETALISTENQSVEVETITGQPIRRVEVKINEQTLYYYEDDQLALKSPIVSGNRNITDETPTGKFEVRRKVTDTSLRGRDYLEHVDYWVGFDQTGGMYGLHDAQWRSEFGGDIWLYDPSRGCVNMPLDKIGLLFERLKLGDEISIYE